MTEVEKDRYWIVARDKARLLTAMMRTLAGNAHISFEGDLSRCRFVDTLAPDGDETPALQRHTSEPRLDFVVLNLERETVEPILKVVMPGGGLMKGIIHVQIEKHGRLEFGAYDNFHPECIVCFRGVPTDLLSSLQQSGVIRSWTEPYAGARRWHG